jgi:hypothetical protein
MSVLTIYPPFPELAFSLLGQRHLEQLWLAEMAVEQAWKGEPSAAKLEALTHLQAARETVARFSVDDFSCLLLDPPAAEYRLSWADNSLRMQSAGGFDVRLTEAGGQLVLEGRRRPAFHLYEYLTSRLGPGRCEDSRIESAEGLQVRRRDFEGRVLT